MKKEETFDEWFNRVHSWWKKNRKESPNTNEHSEKISYSKAGEDEHIIRHGHPKDEHINVHGHDLHEVTETDTLPEKNKEKSLKEWVDKIHKVWEEHS